MTFQISKNPNAAKEAALKAARDAAAARKPKSEATAITEYIAPEDCPEKIRLLGDDSGSMSSQFENARKGIVEFLRNCIPNQTAVAVHFLNGKPGHWNFEYAEKFKNLAMLQSNLLLLGVAVDGAPFVSGGTPLFEETMKMLQTAPFGTRFVMFTDGSPTDSLDKRDFTTRSGDFNEYPFDKYSADIVIAEARKRQAPFDTVFFGGEYSTSEIALLKYIAEQTGGFFLHFNPSKVNFATAFKYLAPVNRYLLADPAARKEIEDGTRS